MTNREIMLFATEIETQCGFVARADSQLWDALKATDNTGVWLALQSILISSANISKMLWGSGGSGSATATKRQPLRALLKTADDSPLKSPDLRNDFEHFDERIERWASESPGMFVGRNIWHAGGSPEVIAGEKPDTRFGHYDPVTGEVSFWARRVRVNDLTQEAARILPLARSAIVSPSG